MFPPFRGDAITADYEQMQRMLFGEIPPFEEMCERIAALEVRINDV